MKLLEQHLLVTILVFGFQLFSNAVQLQKFLESCLVTGFLV